MNSNTATQKKGQEIFRRPLYSYVFWGVESEFEVKIAPCPLSSGHNFKKRYYKYMMKKYGMIMDFKPLNSIMKAD